MTKIQIKIEFFIFPRTGLNLFEKKKSLIFCNLDEIFLARAIKIREKSLLMKNKDEKLKL